MISVYDGIQPPAEGKLVELAPGVMWLRMPLPFELDHINLYLIADGDAYAIIDTGVHDQATMALWEVLIADYSLRISKVIVTHMHPDHIGNAGWLTEKFRVPLAMSFGEYFSARSIRAGASGADPWIEEQFMQRCNLPREYIQRALSNRQGFSSVVSPIPTSFERLDEGQMLVLGDAQWQVLVGRGHSPEHVCLYCAEKGLLLSGDHVLPEISPNIGVYSTEPKANPLAHYLRTLQAFNKLPADTCVLPSHRMPFYGLHDRIDALVKHHQNQLERLCEFCQIPRTLDQCLPQLFNRPLSGQAMFFANAEGLAHLNYLIASEQVSRELSDSGAYLYQTRV